MSNDPDSPFSATPGPGLPQPPTQPGKIQAIAIMTLVGGIVGVVTGLVWVATLCGIPLGIYSLVMGILCILKGARLVGSQAHRETPPRTTAILQIINVICGDIPNLIAGILILVFLNDPEVAAWYQPTDPSHYPHAT